MTAARSARLCAPSGQARCFLAAYGHQHCLPLELLEAKGILSSLLQDDQGIRLFSQAEVAACHGASCPVFLSRDLRLGMQVHGNCLATPQALLTLAHALKLWPGFEDISPPALVEQAGRYHVRSTNSLLLPTQTGWILARQDAVSTALAAQGIRSEVSRCLPTQPFAWRQVRCLAQPGRHALQSMGLHCCPFVDWACLCIAAGLPDACSLRAGADGADEVFELDQPICVNHLSGAPIPPTLSSPVLLFMPQGVACLNPHTPEVYHHLWRTFQLALQGAGTTAQVACFRPMGAPHTSTSDLPRHVLLSPSAQDIWCTEPVFSADVVAACVFEIPPNSQTAIFTVLQPGALDVWLGFPWHLLHCMGYRVDLSPYPPSEEESLEVLLSPRPQGAALTLQGLQTYIRDLLFLASLRTDSEPEGTPSITLLVQDGTRDLDAVRVPADLTPASILDRWLVACHATGCPAQARIFSGPHSIEPTLPVAILWRHGKVHTKARAGSRILTITIAREIVGGGAKEESRQLATTRAAALMLDRGITLTDASGATERLIAAAGAQACLKALGTEDPSERWAALQQVALEGGLTLPQGDNQVEKAARRLQAAVRRRRLRKPQHVSAADFTLQEGTWCGVDGQAVPILERLEHDVSGVILLDQSTASSDHLAFMASLRSEALCAVVIGHECPDPASCSGRLSTPVSHRVTGQAHLLAACHHNLGMTAIRPRFEHEATVEVSPTVCCSFAMFAADASSPEAWQAATHAPVRTVQDVFRAQGLPQVCHHPWGRSFRHSGRPSTQELADSFQFHAKVSTTCLEEVLKASGHNCVFVVPKSWDHHPLDEWAVVWVGRTREEAAKQAILTQEQYGIVKGRTRYGLRVKAACFERAFRALRPNEVPPAQVAVRSLYRMGPMPASASMDTVSSFLSKLRWKAKVLKMLNPTFWLVGSADPPPSNDVPSCNGEPVLISPVPERSRQMPVVQAGGSLPSSSPPGASEDAMPPDPWDLRDPWSTYQARSAGPSSSHSGGPKASYGPCHTTGGRVTDAVEYAGTQAIVAGSGGQAPTSRGRRSVTTSPGCCD